MNNRQKAKHFKRLYEMGLPKKPYPVVYKTLQPVHYKATKIFRRPDIAELDKNMRDKVAAASLLKEMEDVVKENMRCEYDKYSDAYRYSLDFWIEDKRQS